MATLSLTTFGTRPSDSSAMYVWLFLGCLLFIAMLIGLLFRKKRESTYIRRQGLIWSLVAPILLLCMAMAMPEMFGTKFGAGTALAMVIAGIGADRMTAWTGSPFLAMVSSFLLQMVAFYVISSNAAGCPGSGDKEGGQKKQKHKGHNDGDEGDDKKRSESSDDKRHQPVSVLMMQPAPTPMMQAAPMMQAPPMMQPMTMPMMQSMPMMQQFPVQQAPTMVPAAVPMYIK